MDIRKVKKLIELLQETGIGEIEIHEGEESVRISRQHMMPAAAPMTIAVPSSNAALIHAQPMHAGPDTAIKPAEVGKPMPEGHIVKSPMVGTVYLAAAPGEKPFVEVGKTVKVGDTLCVIEAMKMFNQIEADKAGVISARLVENGSPIEYDQGLFIIEE
jgi:acetyl-CoA carboxylase biotin carboxyl carrier protein